MKVIVETPYGRVTSKHLAPNVFAGLKDSMLRHYGRVNHLTLDTVKGPVFLPKAALDQSVIRFIEAKM